MSNQNSENFLYQINFNRKKYPEICEHLEAAKNQTGGIAWYLRNLIAKDIEERKAKNESFELPSKQINEDITPIKREETPIDNNDLQIQSEDQNVQDHELNNETDEQIESNESKADNQKNKVEAAEKLSSMGGFDI